MKFFFLILFLIGLFGFSACVEKDGVGPVVDTVVVSDDSSFEDIVLNATLPVVVEFWSPECGPCVKMRSEFDTLAQDRAGELLVVSLNTRENQATNNKYGQGAQPYTSFFRNGKELKYYLGYMTADELSDLADEVFF